MTESPKFTPGQVIGTIRQSPPPKAETPAPEEEPSKILGPDGRPANEPRPLLVPRKAEVILPPTIAETAAEVRAAFQKKD